MLTRVLLGRLHSSIQVNQVLVAAWASVTDKVVSALLCHEKGLYHVASWQTHVPKPLFNTFHLFGAKKHLLERCSGPQRSIHHLHAHAIGIRAHVVCGLPLLAVQWDTKPHTGANGLNFQLNSVLPT